MRARGDRLFAERIGNGDGTRVKLLCPAIDVFGEFIAYPVHHEMVGRQNAHVSARVVEHQGLDPCAELLLGQIGAKTLLAKVPEGIHSRGSGGGKLHGIQTQILLPFDVVIHRRPALD